jgi:hypothetical protein
MLWAEVVLLSQFYHERIAKVAPRAARIRNPPQGPSSKPSCPKRGTPRKKP